MSMEILSLHKALYALTCRLRVPSHEVLFLRRVHKLVATASVARSKLRTFIAHSSALFLYKYVYRTATTYCCNKTSKPSYTHEDKRRRATMARRQTTTSDDGAKTKRRQNNGGRQTSDERQRSDDEVVTKR